MNKLISILICFLSILSFSFAQEKSANLIVVKSILTKEPAASKDLVINIQIFNVGEGSAYDIRLEGNREGFPVVCGLVKSKWDRLLGGANISHTYVVKPPSSGIVEAFPVEVQFRNSPRGPIETVSSTYSPFYYFESSREAARRSELHLKEWFIFIVLCLLSLAPAFWNWFSIVQSYEQGVKKQK